jgi:hypothetical protein
MFAFISMILFLWVREGSLTGAGAVMDKFLGHAGSDIVEGGGRSSPRRAMPFIVQLMATTAPETLAGVCSNRGRQLPPR